MKMVRSIDLHRIQLDPPKELLVITEPSLRWQTSQISKPIAILLVWVCDSAHVQQARIAAAEIKITDRFRALLRPPQLPQAED